MNSISVLKSALQKFIRRGMHDKVLEVTNELCDYMQEDIGLRETFWARLHIIATEDIGIAQYGTHLYLERMRDEADKDPNAFRSACLRASHTLSHSSKSRLTDNAYIYLKQQPLASVSYKDLYKFIELRDEWSLFKLVTAVYKQRRNSHAKLRDRDIYIAVKALVQDNHLVDEVESLWTVYQTNYCVLYLMHLVLLICRPPRSAVTPVEELPETVPSLEEIPDFVYDMHTTKGRKMERGFKHFVESSCELEDCHIPDPYYELLVKSVE